MPARFTKPALSKVAIVIPVHNEETCLAACLEAACISAAALGNGQSGLVVAVLDNCTDASAEIASRFPVHTVTAHAGSVGAARALGARAAIGLGATWLAFTDADTVVSADWVTIQRSLDADAVCGTVAVSDWHLYDEQVRSSYEAHYVDADGHRHIHGANFGLSSEAYQKCGGFEHVKVDEDVRLVQRLMDGGFKVAWSAQPRVATSARLANRVSGGFGGFIQGLVHSIGIESAGSQYEGKAA